MQTTFELHTCIRGRWSIEQVYTHKERETAVDEAMRRLDLKHISAVRVIRETYDKTTNESTEVTVFDSSRPQSQTAPPRTAAGGKPAPKAKDKPDSLKQANPKRQLGGMVGTMVMAVALVVAVAVLIIVFSRGQELLGI